MASDAAVRRAPELGGFVLGVHDKHRERVRRRFDEAGDKFEDYQLLELLLFYSIPRIDTNPIAHELINRFGSLRAVLDASPEQLTCVKGVGASSATLIKLVRSAAAAYLRGDEEPCAPASSESIGRMLVPRFLGLREERMYLICLNGAGKVTGDCEISRGGASGLNFDFRAVVESAISRGASSVILAHNHPSGIALPSEADVITTRNLKNLLRMLNITLADHIIVSGSDWVSMAESGQI